MDRWRHENSLFFIRNLYVLGMSALMQSLANLGATWTIFYLTWGLLGTNLGQLGANLATLWPTWTTLGPTWANLNSILS